MGLQINNNVAAFNAYRNLSVNQGSMEKSLEKLSSGLRINRAADDASGLSISEGLRSQIGGLKQATRNAQDGVSLVQTAEGTLNEVHNSLQRMNELAVQHNSGVQSLESKAALTSEFNLLKAEIGRIQDTATFNGVKLFPDTAASASFQVGHKGDETLAVALKKVDVTAATIAFTAGTPAVQASNGPDGVVGGGDDIAAVAAIAGTGGSDSVQAEITKVSAARADLGATQNRFESTIKSLNVAVENLTASESRIRDTDMALEMVNFSKSQILSQAGTAMLAQAKDAPQGVLQLLR